MNMATGDYMYYSDGHNVWPLGQYPAATASVDYVHLEPGTTVITNWRVCSQCGAWYFANTVHACASPPVIASQSSRQPYKCPCCDGYGEREARGALTVDSAPVPCKSCGGRGIVFE